MIQHLPKDFANKKILLLQGPVGPFFYNLAKDLTTCGAQVRKINFNKGDEFFYPENFIAFRGRAEEWKGFLTQYLEFEKFDAVFLFGDCRKIHQTAREVIKEFGIDLFVFEEGYLRPDYITFEKDGVNAFSNIPRSPVFYKNLKFQDLPPVKKVGQSIYHGILYCITYYYFTYFYEKSYPHYKHHRPICWGEGFKWLRSLYRKHLYRFTEAGIQERLVSEFSKKFFLVPLQVYNDSQILIHSDYKSNNDFISEVIASFAKNASIEEVLVIKQHPLDRAYNNYKGHIKECAELHGVDQKRIFYIHDQHLPTLLEHAKGVVVINSTVGLQAVHYKCPTKVCGRSIYDIFGMTFGKSLDEFWQACSNFEVDYELYENFKSYLIEKTQINGNFLKKLEGVTSACGLNFVDPIIPVEEVAVGETVGNESAVQAM